MKKVSVFLIATIFSGAALAEEFPLDKSGYIEMGRCTLLNEDVKINLSTNVVAAVSCGESVVALSACHSGGKVSQRTIYEEPIGNPSVMVECKPTEENKSTCKSKVITGPAIPGGSTEFGTVLTSFPGGDTCKSEGVVAEAKKLAGVKDVESGEEG